MTRDVDRLFADEPTPPEVKPVPPPLRPGEDPPELAARLVSALDGQVRPDAHLEKRFDLLTAEMRDGFKLLGEQLLPTVRKLEERQTDHSKQLAEHTRLLFALGDRQNEITERLDAIEAAIRKPKKRRKAGKR